MAEDNIHKNKGLPKGSDEFVEAFARGLAVIRAFGKGSGSFTITEIAERTDMAPAGARRLLYTLVTLGYARLDGKRFELTPQMLELGFAYLSSLSLREVALAIIDKFAQDTGEVCTLSVLQGTEVVYVVRAEVRSPLARSMGVGDRTQVHTTSSGHILLSGLDAPDLNAILDTAPFQRFTPYTRCERHELLEAVELAKKNGWAIANEELEFGVCGLSVPIRDEVGTIVAAITVSANLARHSPEEMQSLFLSRLFDIAQQISRGLPRR